MARTRDYLVRFAMREDGSERDANDAVRTAVTTTKYVHSAIELSPSTVNYRFNFGGNFSTPTLLFLQEQNGATFTYSLTTSTRHHLVAANGCAFLDGSFSALFLSNNSTSATRPKIEIILAR